MIVVNDTDLLIFDCDGVLVDSEPFSLVALRTLLMHKGIRAELPEIKLLFLGRSLKDTTRIAFERFGVSLTKEDTDSMTAGLLASLDLSLTEVLGARAFISAIKQPYCVASSSGIERIKRSLVASNLHDLFNDEAIFSASMVKRGKPYPDLFMKAAGDSGFHVSDCIVIEDSPAGVEAGKSAGMRVIGFCGGSHVDASAHADALMRAGADAVYDSYEKLKTVFSSFNARR